MDLGSEFLERVPRTAPEIPEHKLVKPIASGAYGEVWLARNRVGTERAVKIVRRDRHASVESFEREFKGLQKFEPVSRTHEGLVDILTLGVLSGESGFYYVMELADQAEAGPNPVTAKANNLVSFSSPGPTQITGLQSVPQPEEDYEPRTLRNVFNTRGALPAKEVINLGRKLTSALAHLHGHGLIHRDVKPSNILYVDGEPKLADAGLVAQIDDARSLVGTAGYIAPEGPGSPQADLYALGKVLYEAAFGKDRHEFPTLPGDIASRPEHAALLEINAVLLKACADNPRERYQSADLMHADLELVRAGRSVRERQAWQNLGRRASKSALPALAALVAVALFSFLPNRGPLKSEPVMLSKSEEANDAYQDGVVWFHKNTNDGIKRSITSFKRAIEIDPEFARAHAALAYAYGWASATFNDWQLLRKAQQEAVKALDSDTRLGEAHWPIGCAMALLDRNWKGADHEYKLALELSPNSPDVLYQYANYLVWANRLKEAKVPLEKALLSESQSVLRLQNASWLLLATGQYDRAIKKSEEAIEKEPSTRQHLTSSFLVPACRAKRDFHKAISLSEQADLPSTTRPDEVRARYKELREAYDHDGERGYWLKLLTWLKPDDNVLWVAALHARVNNKDQAFACLNQAWEKEPVDLAFSITWDPDYDSLRTDPRFAKILERLNLTK